MSESSGNDQKPIGLPKSGDQRRDDALALRMLAVGAALVAGWLGGRTDGRGALRGEKDTAVDPRALPAPVKAASHAVTTVGYPFVYLPLAWWLSSQLGKHGVSGHEAVPRAALSAWITYHLVKTLVHRERPPAEQDGGNNDDRSYPSGHATAAAALAVSAAYLWLRSENGQARVVLRLGVAAPAIVGVSRIVLGKHWPTDILGGIATGIAVGAHVTANYRDSMPPPI